MRFLKAKYLLKIALKKYFHFKISFRDAGQIIYLLIIMKLDKQNCNLSIEGRTYVQYYNLFI